MTDVFSNLPPHLAARMRATVAKREDQGFNVHFINERGERDRYSFATAERADAFRVKLRDLGLTVIA